MRWFEMCRIVKKNRKANLLILKTELIHDTKQRQCVSDNGVMATPCILYVLQGGQKSNFQNVGEDAWALALTSISSEPKKPNHPKAFTYSG